jgi:hypothetical protein
VTEVYKAYYASEIGLLEIIGTEESIRRLILSKMRKREI